MDDKTQKRLGEILVGEGVITQRQLDVALQEQRQSGKFVGEILVGLGVAPEEKVTQVLSEQLGFAFVDMSQISIEPKALSLIPHDIADRLEVMPLFVSQDALTVAMVNPLDVKAVDELHAVCRLRIKPVFGCPSAIKKAQEESYYKLVEETKIFHPATHKNIQTQTAFVEATGEESEDAISLKEAASLAPVVEMVDGIIAEAVKKSASDIHLEPQRGTFDCRYRIDGILYPVSQIDIANQNAIISRIKIMANMDITEKRLPQDGRIQTFVGGRDVDLRISTFPTIYGENLAIRILDRSHGVFNLEQLGFSVTNLRVFTGLIRRPYGIILVTGPTGSGKTTTLYAALTQINTPEKNIITLEDPIEYEIPHVRQSQVNVKAGLTFASGLRSILRQDPDIIMIGEIRDKETADIAIHAALTGHLVFSTLHTNDAPSAATRLVDMGIEPFLIASSIIGILAQRLVRVLCPDCKKAYKPSAELLAELGLGKADEKYTFYKEEGCARCNHRGYVGRTGIYEMLLPTDAIKEMIIRKESDANLRKEAQRLGMKTLRQGGIEKVIEGFISVSELLRVTENV